MAIDRSKPATMVPRLRAAWQALRSRSGPRGVTADLARARLMYDRFREILGRNDATLQLIADIEDRLSGRSLIPLDLVVRRTRKAAMDVFVMVKNLNQISGNAHTQLYPALLAIGAELDEACPRSRAGRDGRLMLPLERLRRGDAASAGTKMARLGEIRARTGLSVPDGFVVTTSAFSAFLTANELWERTARLDDVFERHGNGAALAAACREVESAIRSAEVPEAVAAAMYGAYDELAQGRDLRVAMRSSAVGEDTRASHAGQYRTELDVGRSGLTSAYRAVIASACSPAAVSYRFERGITASDAAMAVGCIRMAHPRCSGILFSRLFEDLGLDRVAVCAVAGSAAALASGELECETWVAGPGRDAPENPLLTPAESRGLVAAARLIEQIFDGPQEIEWALEPEGLCILQSRPMVAPPTAVQEPGPPLGVAPPLLSGGQTACPGAGSGPVVIVRDDDDLDSFPDGGVLVARHSSPLYSRVLTRCAAVVTDIGSIAGHMAILAREYSVPAMVGTGRATTLLEPGAPVTVDATRREIFAGILPHPKKPPAPAALDDTPTTQLLRRIARVVTPLSLTDPASPGFTPAACRSLHDITRYVHEKTFEAVFHWGDVSWGDTRHARRLQVHLPLTIDVIDVGGGLRDAGSGRERDEAPQADAADAGASGIHLEREDVLSVPFRAMLAGMLDTRIRWDRPRPLSARGFLAVVGERIAGLPGEALRVGGASYAIVSDRYLNFSTKAGYHFATVDTYCGQSVNKNYIHFRFAGGAADDARRERRVRFIASVLGSLGFTVQTRGDVLVARLSQLEQGPEIARLEDMGRLCMCTRQMDMLMDSDASPEHFARAFLSGQMDRF